MPSRMKSLSLTAIWDDTQRRVLMLNAVANEEPVIDGHVVRGVTERGPRCPGAACARVDAVRGDVVVRGARRRRHCREPSGCDEGDDADAPLRLMPGSARLV